ncbi:MAG: helix-turn-helix transcriptional regulator [Lachnospiraceae bacterium]|nr:helix-turn-helix transcriptional regulator [Lachnospiraceae bacterium]
MNRDKISEKMRSLRKEKKLTQKELAAKLYVTPSTVSKWENGVAVPDIYAVTSMADVFGVSVTELLG